MDCTADAPRPSPPWVIRRDEVRVGSGHLKLAETRTLHEGRFRRKVGRQKTA